MSYFRNVQYHGTWVAGGTYTYEVWAETETTYPANPHYNEYWNQLITYDTYALFLNDYELPGYPYALNGAAQFEDGLVDLALITDTEIVEGTSETDGGVWIQKTVYIPEGLASAKYKLVHAHWGFNYVDWSVSSHLLTPVYEELEITILPVGSTLPPDPIIPPVPDDPEELNSDSFWVPGKWENPVWVPEVVGPPYVPGYWDPDGYTPPSWSETPLVIVAAGGGRWNQNLVVAGDNLIYYEEYS